jgi:hypothetical protein
MTIEVEVPEQTTMEVEHRSIWYTTPSRIFAVPVNLCRGVVAYLPAQHFKFTYFLKTFDSVIFVVNEVDSMFKDK